MNDEGTYFAVARAMAHGTGLYTGIWENKPPAIYLLYLGVLDLAGASIPAIRLAATIAVLGLVIVVYRIGTHYGGRESGLVAALLTALLTGVPFLEGTTANAEIFLALAAALGVYAAVCAERRFAGGVALGLAATFKAVAAFDAAAIAVWLAMHRRRSLPWFAGGLIVVAAAVLGVAAVDGILTGMLRDAFAYDLGYVGQGNGGALPWLVGVKLGLLVLATHALRRAPFPYIWLIYALAGAAFSGRIFGHYTLQAVAPASLSIATFLGPVRRPTRVMAWLVSSFAGAAVLAACLGWVLAASGHDSITARRLQYYANFVRYAMHQESPSQYRAQVDDTVNRNIRIAGSIRTLPAGKLLVWGNSPWIYVLSGRLPATPYTSAVRTPAVPGETDTLRRAVDRRSAREIVLVAPLRPPLGPAAAALRRMYRPVVDLQGATIYVER